MKLHKVVVLIAAVIALSAGQAFAGTIPDVAINEVRIDDISGDTDEYFEIVGAPGTSLDGLSYIVIGDGSTGSGTLERVISLSGLSIPSSGFFLAASDDLGTDIAAGVGASIDLTISNNVFENSDNVTHLLVAGLTASVTDDLDDGDTGTLDEPWLAVVDGFSLLETPGSGDLLYASQFGLPTIGPDGNFVPGHVYRIPDATGAWNIGDFLGENDTPGATNIPEPASAFLALGACLAGMIGLRRHWG